MYEIDVASNVMTFIPDFEKTDKVVQKLKGGKHTWLHRQTSCMYFLCRGSLQLVCSRKLGDCLTATPCQPPVLGKVCPLIPLQDCKKWK
jgi:hypothetical protein